LFEAVLQPPATLAVGSADVAINHRAAAKQYEIEDELLLVPTKCFAVPTLPLLATVEYMLLLAPLHDGWVLLGA